MPPDTPDKPTLQKDSLMGELESIKNLLNKETQPLIPTLDDSLEPQDSAQIPDHSQATLLNLDSIFEEALAAPLLNLPEQPEPDPEPAADAQPVIDKPATETPQPMFTAAPAPTTSTGSTAPGQQPHKDFSLELLIQEIVDDAIPLVEAQLRERLSRCAPEVIRQLAAKKLRP